MSGAPEVDARLHNLTGDEEAGLLSLLPYLVKLARKRIGITLKVRRLFVYLMPYVR